MTNASVAPKEFAPSSLNASRTVRTLQLQVAIAAQQRELMDQQRKAEIGARIKELRERSSYRQPWVAERVGVTLRAYQKWEAGGGTEYENYERLADIFGVSVDYILRGDAPDLLKQLDGKARIDDLEQHVTTDIEAVAAEFREYVKQLLERQDKLAEGLAAVLEDLKALRERPSRRKAA